MNQDGIEYRTPLDELIDKEEFDATEDERSALLQILKESMHFLIDNKNANPEAIYWGILYALCDGAAMEISTRERAKQIGVSSGLISHYTKEYQREVLHYDR